MVKSLVIVESPSKAKTINKYLGKNYQVEASVGHVKDLPSKNIGVDVEHGFLPTYEIIKGKKKVIDQIKKAAKNADVILLAPDPDREGEAIAWHIAEELKGKKQTKTAGLTTADGVPIKRVLFNEITKKAVQDAIDHPQEIDHNKFEAQQARRILDRIVGYKISPLLWDKVRRGLSAGRVQSVAVRLVCEREDEITKFISEEYWSLEVTLEGSQKPIFLAKLDKKSGEKITIPNESHSQKILQEIKAGTFVLREIIKKEQKRYPTPPFITSKLQQEAARKLGFTAKKTMMLAQRLYEGIEIEGETVGLITYMRTDSVRISDQAIADIRDHILKEYGKDFLPQQPVFYKTKKDAQNAHEAIRPTSMQHHPDHLKNNLDRDMLRLYELIWKRSVASQMMPAVYDSTLFLIDNGNYEFRANGSILKFAGFIKVYQEDTDEDIKNSDADDENKILPNLKQGESLSPIEFKPLQHFTQPPPRYTEASLVKALEEKGIGRPSTYATIMSTIVDREYVEKIEKKFRPTQLGRIVNDLLVEHFPRILDVKFTAKMEEELDDVEDGKRQWQSTLADFYTPFQEDLKEAIKNMPNVKAQEIKTDFICEKCQGAMVIKFGKNGEFLACSSYPECKNTKEFKRTLEGKIEIVKTETATNEICEKCGSPMLIKSGKFGRFMACSGYPACKNAKPIGLGVACPTCGKDVSERRSKKGKVFYGCTGYPACTFASWDKPLNQVCPLCASPYLLEKVLKTRGKVIKCPNKDCGYEQDVVEKDEAAGDGL